MNTRLLASRVNLLIRAGERLYFHLKRGHWRLIKDRISKEIPSAKSGIVATTPDILIKSLSTHTVIIIDHILGGGANQYRDLVIKQHQESGRDVLLWTFIPVAFRFRLKLYSVNNSCKETWADWSLWEKLASSGYVDEILFNNAVSYPEPERLPERILFFKKQSNAKLTVLVHDFFMVCPSHFLLDNNGDYCGIPDTQICAQCLPCCKDQFVRLYLQRDITVWRTIWAELLNQSENIICFSDNTRNLLQRAFASIVIKTPFVIPHTITKMERSYQYPDNRDKLVIAMVGNINLHKGSDVFIEIVNKINSTNINYEAVIIGSLNGSEKSSYVIETGPYNHTDLPDLLNRYRVNVVLMLSIWPETFSYVTHELISLGVPLISFDTGAQGDAVNVYELGITLNLKDKHNAGYMADSIINFKKTLDIKLISQ